nr:immunoglobulin heavy chain junction region [Mus musculus]
CARDYYDQYYYGMDYW